MTITHESTSKVSLRGTIHWAQISMAIFLILAGIFVDFNPSATSYLLIIAGIAILFFQSVMITQFDKVAQKVIVREYFLFRRREKEYPLDKIKEVRLQSIWRRGRERFGQFRRDFSLVVKGEGDISLNNTTYSYMVIPKQYYRIGKRLAQWLNVPFKATVKIDKNSSEQPIKDI